MSKKSNTVRQFPGEFANFEETLPDFQEENKLQWISRSVRHPEGKGSAISYNNIAARADPSPVSRQ